MITQDTKELLKFNAHGVSPAEIYREACESACRAVDDHYAKHGETLYCGFGTVVIRPARGSFVKFLKDNKIGDNGYNGGWRISSYDIMRSHKLCGTQSMSLKEEACDAFAKVLEKYGMTAYSQSRAD
jgi:hypothetical protein